MPTSSPKVTGMLMIVLTASLYTFATNQIPVRISLAGGKGRKNSVSESLDRE